MLNPFEQLKISSMEAPAVFEAVVGQIIRATESDVRQVRVYRGDGGVDVSSGRWGENGELHVFQVKYFTDVLDASRRSKIKESFETALACSDFKLIRWTLCLPSRLRKEDLAWFSEWSASQQVTMDLLDGDDLNARLELKECVKAREMLCRAGVQIQPTGPWLVPEIHPKKIFLPTVQRFVVEIQIQNRGDKSAKNVSMIFQHSENRAAPSDADKRWWSSESGSINPRKIRCTQQMDPGVQVPVATIPFSNSTSGDVWFEFQIFAEDCAPQTWHVFIKEDQALGCVPIHAQMGQIDSELKKKIDEIPHQIKLSDVSIEILKLIFENEDADSRGLIVIHEKIQGPETTYFIARIEGEDKALPISTRKLNASLKELLEQGWFEDPLKGNKTTSYPLKEEHPVVDF